jgi:hypothetical protein
VTATMCMAMDARVYDPMALGATRLPGHYRLNRRQSIQVTSPVQADSSSTIM